MREALLLSPLAAILQQTRHWLIDAPSVVAATGGGARLLVPVGIGLAALAVGFWVFGREAPRIAEEL